MTGNGGDCELSTRVGIRPLGFKRKNQLQQVRQKHEDPTKQDLLLLLLVCADVYELSDPFRAIFFGELFEQDLSSLSIGRALGDEDKTLRIRDFFGCLGSVKFVCHLGAFEDVSDVKMKCLRCAYTSSEVVLGKLTGVLKEITNE